MGDMGRDIRDRGGEKGFTLLELLPGLVLLLALMTVVGSLGTLAVESQRRARAKADLVHALGYAWPAWGEGEALAALAVRAGGGWQISVFPERSWLPGSEAGGRAAVAYQLCRRRTGHEEVSYWEVGRCGGDGEEFLEGEVLARVRIISGGEEPEREGPL